MEILNRNLEERFRITISMGTNGVPSFSVIGPHTTLEVIGLMQSIATYLSAQIWGKKQPDLIKELVAGGMKE